MSAVRSLTTQPVATAACKAVVQRCNTEALPKAWPSLQVLALFRASEPQATEALGRAAARRLTRQVFREQVGDGPVAQSLDLPGHVRGAQSQSISHEATISLLAWCSAGAIGVDLVTLDSLACACQDELVATAKLYLGHDAAKGVAAAAHASEARTCFAVLWASMEAKLKCLGMELDEWHRTRAQILASVSSVRVNAVDASGKACADWVGSVAWRAERQAC